MTCGQALALARPRGTDFRICPERPRGGLSDVRAPQSPAKEAVK
jgi:hypothetical protein